MTPRTLAIGTHDEQQPSSRPLISGPCIMASAVAMKNNGERLDAILDNDSQVVCYFAQPDPSDSQEAFERHGQRCAFVLKVLNDALSPRHILIFDRPLSSVDLDKLRELWDGGLGSVQVHSPTPSKAES